LLADTVNIAPSDLTLDRYETCIYVIGFKGDPESPVKIGWSTNVLKRLRALQAANPTELEVVAVIRTRRALVDEQMLHEYLAESRLSGEWFRRSKTVQQLIHILQELSRTSIVDERCAKHDGESIT
jgi:hypothetical protein